MGSGLLGLEISNQKENWTGLWAYNSLGIERGKTLRWEVGFTVYTHSSNLYCWVACFKGKRGVWLVAIGWRLVISKCRCFILSVVGYLLLRIKLIPLKSFFKYWVLVALVFHTQNTHVALRTPARLIVTPALLFAPVLLVESLTQWIPTLARLINTRSVLPLG